MSLRILPTDLQKKALIELHEVPERIFADIKHLKDWITKQAHLKCRTDDQWLLTFLRGCKFSLEKAKNKLDMYYTMRTLVPEWFGNRDPFSPEIQETLKRGIYLPLPNTNETNCITILVRYEKADPDKISMATLIKVVLMMIDILLNENDHMMTGQQTISDFYGLNMRYLPQITPAKLKTLITCIQKGYPLRVRALHSLNAPTAISSIHNMAKLFLPNKFFDRIHYYNGDKQKNISKLLPNSILPLEYGGQGPSVDKLIDEWKAKVESYSDWFKEDEQYRSDESKRTGKAVTTADLFGVEGSFRKLELD